MKKGIGKQYMDTMRNILGEFVAAETVLIGQRNLEQQSTANTTQNVTIFGSILAVIFGALVAWKTTNSISKPAVLLTQRIRDVQQASDFSKRVKIEREDEVGQAATAFNGLMQDVETAFAEMNSRMKAFSAGNLDMRIDATMKGGLNSLKNEANALMQQVAENAEQAHLDELKKQKQAEQDKLLAAENFRIKQALDNVSSNVMMADPDRNIVYMNRAASKLMSDSESDLKTELPHFNSQKLVGGNIDEFHANPNHQHRVLENLTSEYKTEIEVAGLTSFQLIANPVMDEENNRLGTVIEWKSRTVEVQIEKEIDSVIEAAAAGDLSKRIDNGWQRRLLLRGFLKG